MFMIYFFVRSFVGLDKEEFDFNGDYFLVF